MFKTKNLPFFFILFCFACANIGSPPVGGKKDETPPELDISASTKNYQTNFKKQDIVLVFDEYIELKDVFNQVIVSPPLEKRWKLTNKLKTVRFSFGDDEVLRENATYTINFGEAVRDYTEGNAARDLRFVFSTGNFIDSMEVSGNLTDALTGAPIEGALLMLYDNLADSVVRTERPFYFAKTDKQGSYKIQNVKSDSFKIFALKDEDLNYLFNQESELIGFPDSIFFLSDVKEKIPAIGMFKERPSFRLSTPKNNQFGMIKLAFNQTPYDVTVNHEDIGQEVFYETAADSILVWYNQSDTSSWQLFIEQGESFKDTFLVQPTNRNPFFENKKLVRANIRKANTINLNPTKEARILFNHPISQIDSKKILLFEDSVKNLVIPQLKIEGKELIIQYSWKGLISYQLQILPEAVTDFFQIKNQDTISQHYLALEKKSFGNIHLKVTNLNPELQYIIHLYLKDKTNLVDLMKVSGHTDYEKSFFTTPPGEYLLEIVTDLNQNGYWDSGNYDLKKQPEPLFSKKLEALRENWEVNAEISVTE